MSRSHSQLKLTKEQLLNLRKYTPDYLKTYDDKERLEVAASHINSRFHPLLNNYLLSISNSVHKTLLLSCHLSQICSKVPPPIALTSAVDVISYVFHSRILRFIPKSYDTVCLGAKRTWFAVKAMCLKLTTETNHRDGFFTINDVQNCSSLERDYVSAHTVKVREP